MKFQEEFVNLSDFSSNRTQFHALERISQPVKPDFFRIIVKPAKPTSAGRQKKLSEISKTANINSAANPSALNESAAPKSRGGFAHPQTRHDLRRVSFSVSVTLSLNSRPVFRRVPVSRLAR